MKVKIRFHIDESVSNAVAEGLRRRGIEVTTTLEKGLMSAPDQAQLNFALTENRVIVTHDDDFIKLHSKGIPHAGIVYCHQNQRSIGEIISYLLLI
ncbi:DUF5615 family PIN-like protein [Rivularia sp. UHCC 0363]|uniref:DUF5615 family PIN-like protein n=1 Tax=Rivularia sp. UHCC 0363 TaxID=3110244 RepID=UPI002B20A952|nr:DUF5615 family PIN-like protein [Rivularia sp. UHCC 0363]MEA5594262.1 DUF5615 family PIN-like protein [Rivularia sp. UHCC 0363]